MNTAKILGGFVLGTAVGLATGLLIAPTSGTLARKKLAKKSRVYSQQAIDAVRQYLESLKSASNGNRDGRTSPEGYEELNERNAW